MVGGRETLSKNDIYQLFKHPKPKNQNSSTKSNQRNTIRKTKRNPEPKQDYRTS